MAGTSIMGESVEIYYLWRDKPIFKKNYLKAQY